MFLCSRELTHEMKLHLLSVVELLLFHGASADATSDNGATALALAASNGRTAVVRALLMAGAGLRRNSAELATRDEALAIAAMSGKERSCMELLAAGANPSARPFC